MWFFNQSASQFTLYYILLYFFWRGWGVASDPLPSNLLRNRELETVLNVQYNYNPVPGGMFVQSRQSGTQQIIFASFRINFVIIHTLLLCKLRERVNKKTELKEAAKKVFLLICTVQASRYSTNHICKFQNPFFYYFHINLILCKLRDHVNKKNRVKGSRKKKFFS